MRRFYRFQGVPLIRQTDPNSCWYAAAQMVVNSFMEGPLVGLGPKNAETLRIGLHPQEFLTFAAKNRLRAMYNSEPFVMQRAARNNGFVFDDLVYMLSTYGPLWATTDSLTHVCTLTGVEENDGHPVITYNDPLYGERSLSLYVFNQHANWRSRGYMLHYGGGKKGITNHVRDHERLRIRPDIRILKLNVP